MIYELKITGEGTKEEITRALLGIIGSLVDYDGSQTAQWEDQTLFTQISKK